MRTRLNRSTQGPRGTRGGLTAARRRSEDARGRHARALPTGFSILPGVPAPSPRRLPRPPWFAAAQSPAPTIERPVLSTMRCRPAPVGAATQREVELLATPGARGVIGRGQGETQPPDDRRQAAVRLPQGQGEDEPERQRGFDGEIGIRPLPATGADAHGLPSGDRIRGQPHGDLAALDQRSVVCRPIPDGVCCRVLWVHARRHVEIMHLRCATMARRSIVAHRGRGIRAPAPRFPAVVL